MKFDRTNLRSYMKLYLVSDRHWLKDHTLAQDVEQAVQSGVTFVQIREKDMELEKFIQEASSIKKVCQRYQIPFVVNDSVEVVKAVDADGIHVGQHDMCAKDVRAILGEDKIVGVSAQTVEDALKAQEQGADYLGVGAVFTTNTKDDADDVSFETLKAICEAVDIPVIAIGGITADNLHLLKGSGIDGVAVVSAIMAHKDISKAVQTLSMKIQELIA